MKVLLIKPPLGKLTLGFRNLINLEPLHLEYIASSIPNHDVEILDMTIEKKGLKRRLEKFQPDVVGMNSSAVQTFQVHKIAKYIKSFNPEILTMVGGEQPTCVPEAFIADYIDIIVVGCGYNIVKKILDNYEQKKSFDTIPNLAFPNKGKLLFTPPIKHIRDLDIIPFPSRNLTKKYRQKYYFYFHEPAASIMTSEGCPYRCNFCCEWVKTGGAFVCRSPELVVEELSAIEEDTIFIVDDNAFANIKRVKKIYELIKERGIKKHYIIFCSADLIIRHPEIVEQWAEIGLGEVCLGLESYNNHELRAVGKREDVTVDINTEAIKIVHQNSVDVLASFILFPNWEEGDFNGLVDYIKKTNLYYVELQPLTPLPGTVLYYKRYDDITSHNYELYDLQHLLLPAKLPLKKYYRQLAKAYWRTYNYWRAYKVKPNNPISYNPFHPRAIAFFKLLYSLWNAHKAHSDKKIPFALPHRMTEEPESEVVLNFLASEETSDL